MTKKDTQCLKGIAILMMLCFHVFSQCGHMDSLKYVLFNKDVVYQWSLECQLCVSLFVFVTAYGITAQYIKNNICDGKQITLYSGKRYIKLMLSYVFVYILSFIFGLFKGHTQITYFAGGIRNAIKYIAIDVLGFAITYATPTLNSSWWFMSMAVMLIFILPPLILAVRKFGFLVSLMFLYFLYYTFDFGLIDYHYVVIIAIGLAMNNSYQIFIAKLSQLSHNIFSKIVAMIAVVFAVISVYYRTEIGPLIYTNVLATLLVCIACALSIRAFKPVEVVLSYLGIHSTNMWFVHMFICYYYYSKYIFGLKYDVLVYIGIVAASLLVSICIEKVKKIIRWKEFTDYICKKWDALIKKVSFA